jgi:uncharacterized membrane protein YraQ (UPF0718 family)
MSEKEPSPNKKLIVLLGVFLAAYCIPWEEGRVPGAVQESFLMLSEYARAHVLLCLVPAMFIAGAITVFLNKQAVIHYLGPEAKRLTAYGVASVSGAILAVCSCTVLPLFKGIYRKGAGLGPAIAFLYSGPAINILAIVLSAKVFGWKLGMARSVGAIAFSIIIGLAMALIFRKDDAKRAADSRLFLVYKEKPVRSLGQITVYMGSMIGILVFANWANSRGGSAAWDAIHAAKWWITGAFALALIYTIAKWFRKEERVAWVEATRDFSLQILPLLFAGVMASGFLLGRPGHEGLIPDEWIGDLLGSNSILTNLFAAVVGALMYFATLTEIPIVQGLLGAGMGQGPALALLLAGPSLSLPSILVISGELGWKKTAVYVGLVVILSTLAGVAFGAVV